MAVVQADREQVRRLAERGAAIVEVLPEAEYRELHLPGAIHIPLRKVTSEARSRLPAGRPVVVYCFDGQ